MIPANYVTPHDSTVERKKFVRVCIHDITENCELAALRVSNTIPNMYRTLGRHETERREKEKEELDWANQGAVGLQRYLHQTEPYIFVKCSLCNITRSSLINSATSAIVHEPPTREISRAPILRQSSAAGITDTPQLRR